MISRKLPFLFSGEFSVGFGSGVFDIVITWLALTEPNGIASPGMMILIPSPIRVLWPYWW